MSLLQESSPSRFWAHTGGHIDLKPLGAVPITADQLVDRALISEAFHRFAYAHDENRVDVLESCFTEDAAFSGSHGADVFFTVHGREAIGARIGANIPKLYGQRRHCITNITIEAMTESEASALAYCIVPCCADGVEWKAQSFYICDLRKCEDGFWRFSRMLMGMDAYNQDERDDHIRGSLASE